MKTYAHINQDGFIIGLGRIYLGNGELTPGAQELVDQHGEVGGILAIGEMARPHLMSDGQDMGPDPSIRVAVIDVEAIPGGDGMRYDKMFRPAWKHANGAVQVDMTRALAHAHDLRRAKRDEEMAPFDEVVAKQIPGAAQAAEAERAKLRAKYEGIQSSIDACPDYAALREVARGFLGR